MKKKPLTKKQRETLNFLIRFNSQKQYMPSLIEICAEFNISLASAWERIDYLQKRGWIKSKPKNLKRWIEIK